MSTNAQVPNPEAPAVPPAAPVEAPVEETPSVDPRPNVPVSRVQQILAIVKEQDLVREMGKFEDSVYVALHPLRVLLAKDINSIDVLSMQGHMTDVERWREKVLRYASLAKTFVDHCKSDHFILKGGPGQKITDFYREAYQKKLVAGFSGLHYYLEGLVSSIDSRVNMVKVILRLDEAGATRKSTVIN